VMAQKTSFACEYCNAVIDNVGDLFYHRDLDNQNATIDGYVPVCLNCACDVLHTSEGNSVAHLWKVAMKVLEIIDKNRPLP